MFFFLVKYSQKEKFNLSRRLKKPKMTYIDLITFASFSYHGNVLVEIKQCQKLEQMFVSRVTQFLICRLGTIVNLFSCSVLRSEEITRLPQISKF